MMNWDNGTIYPGAWDAGGIHSWDGTNVLSLRFEPRGGSI
jgi:hypothetical protein